MANCIVAEVISNDVDTIVLVADDYAKAFVRYPTEYFHEFGWGTSGTTSSLGMALMTCLTMSKLTMPNVK